SFVTESHTDPATALAALRDAELDVVVTDLNMRGMHGLELCARVVENRPDVPVLVLTAFGSLETAIGAIRAGAYDFLTKPIELDRPRRARGRARARGPAPVAPQRGAPAPPRRRRCLGVRRSRRDQRGDDAGLRPPVPGRGFGGVGPDQRRERDWQGARGAG